MVCEGGGGGEEGSREDKKARGTNTNNPIWAQGPEFCALFLCVTHACMCKCACPVSSCARLPSYFPPCSSETRLLTEMDLISLRRLASQQALGSPPAASAPSVLGLPSFLYECWQFARSKPQVSVSTSSVLDYRPGPSLVASSFLCGN